MSEELIINQKTDQELLYDLIRETLDDYSSSGKALCISNKIYDTEKYSRSRILSNKDDKDLNLHKTDEDKVDIEILDYVQKRNGNFTKRSSTFIFNKKDQECEITKHVIFPELNFKESFEDKNNYLSLLNKDNNNLSEVNEQELINIYKELLIGRLMIQKCLDENSDSKYITML